MDFTTMTMEELETRVSEIVTELADADKEKIEELNKELDSIEERKAVIEKENAETRAKAFAVASGEGEVIKEESTKMTNNEIRNTPEYIKAYAKYIFSGKDTECRALLTEQVKDGVVPVPEFVENKIETAWESDEVFRRVSRTTVPGNDKVGFEVSATDAEFHTEGGDAPDEEELVLGIVDIVANYIKKWITCSDKALAVGPNALLDYLYDEIEYRIIKLAGDTVIAKILASPAVSTTSAVGVPQIAGKVDPGAIIDAIAKLSSNARNRVFIASGQTIADVKKMALQASYMFDPFQNLTVIQNDTIAKGAIIGDLAGVRANLPEGGAVKFIRDDYSLAEADLIKIVGKMLVGIEVVTPGMFAVITGEEASE